MISLPLIAYRLYDVGLKKSANTSVHFFFFLSFFKKLAYNKKLALAASLGHTKTLNSAVD